MDLSTPLATLKTIQAPCRFFQPAASDGPVHPGVPLPVAEYFLPCVCGMRWSRRGEGAVARPGASSCDSTFIERRFKEAYGAPRATAFAAGLSKGPRMGDVGRLSVLVACRESSFTSPRASSRLAS
eukprot:scaffold31682_cov31-Tisochrysis_lutea.AAC.2